MIELYRNAWSHACHDASELFEQLREDDINLPTDCPGWSVRDVVAHLAHIEAVLAGLVPDTDASGGASSGSQVTSQYTERGIQQRRELPFSELVKEFNDAVQLRQVQLADISDDGPTPDTPGGVDWSWETLLRNRVIDVWVHDQDIRRAVKRPGGMDAPAAQVTATTFSYALPIVLAKRVGAKAGTSARWVVDGPVPFDFLVAVGDDGRARFTDESGDVDVTLRMTTEEFTILGAGRRQPADLHIEVSGDLELGEQIMRNMAVTP